MHILFWILFLCCTEVQCVKHVNQENIHMYKERKQQSQLNKLRHSNIWGASIKKKNQGNMQSISVQLVSIMSAVSFNEILEKREHKMYV